MLVFFVYRRERREVVMWISVIEKVEVIEVCAHCSSNMVKFVVNGDDGVLEVVNTGVGDVIVGMEFGG